MNHFKKLNLLGGWGVFAVSLLVYILTLEPTASLWDCSEFIATSYKLEVGHPPGAPLFMMLNRFFTFFAPSTAHVALMVNLASAVASSLTIAFLFWTISHLAMRLQGKRNETITKSEEWLCFISAAIGSLAYAFTDTFWFSAIEGEVYAQSSLFTAVVFWAMLKWEDEADSPRATRWIVFVAYLIGLSIGVHLLNLLAIPALVLIYYYRKVQNKTKLGWWKAFGLSVVILGFILFIIIPKIPTIGAFFDRIAVNSLGLPVNVGFALFFIALMGLLSYGVYLTHKKGKVILNLIMLCTTVIVLGYSSYASVVIRSMANPPMNSNAPSDPYQLIALLGREQYGQTPLISGQYYSSPMVDYGTKKEYYYDSENKKYVSREVTDYSSVRYAPGTTTLFPRMYKEEKANSYKAWAGVKGKTVKLQDGSTVTVPTFAENLRFFFDYQLRYMYWRYFLWNFVGRQNDIQGDGGVLYGNWVSGIPFIDNLYIPNIDKLPDHLKENKGYNRYYFLPFLLGVAGLFWQLRKDKDNFNVVMFLFLMTGLAIILYLNQSPGEPRERDYAYAGSFYAFSVWIGLGCIAVYDLLHRVKQLGGNTKLITIITTVACLSVPTLLLAENWDDHTRSNRYIARDLGFNYLESTLPNSIILPYGDNDTFPLWYIQEVEEVRPDVKISNLSYLASDWYANQMLERTNDAAPIKLSIPKRVFYKNNDIIRVAELSEEFTIKEVLDFINDNSSSKRRLLKQLGLDNGEEIIPTRRIAIPVNKENAIKSGIVKQEDAHLMEDTIYIDLGKKTYLDRSEYIFLDMLGSADWSRPIYVTSPMSVSKFGLDKYLQQDGMAYRIVPIKTESDGFNYGRIDSDYAYNNLMNKFNYGNISDPKINVDSFIRTSLTATQLRNTFARLATQLINEGDTIRANKVIDRALAVIPHYALEYDSSSQRLLEALYSAGRVDDGDMLLDEMIDYALSNIEYFTSFSERYINQLRQPMQTAVYTLYNLYVIGQNFDREEKVEPLKEYYEMFM